MTVDEMLKEAYRIGYESRIDRPAYLNYEYMRLLEAYRVAPKEQKGKPLEMLDMFNSGRNARVVDDAMEAMNDGRGNQEAKAN